MLKQIKQYLKEKGVKRPLQVVPSRMLYPFGIETQYSTAIVKLLRPMKVLVKEYLIPQITKWKNEYKKDDWSDDITTTIEGIEFRYFEQTNTEQLVLPYAEKTDKFNKKQFDKQTKSMIGINPLTAEPWLQSLEASWVRENVILIKSISTEYFKDIEGVVRRGVQSGTITKDIAEEIGARFKVSKNKAKLIARDQVCKYNGYLTKERSTDIGLTHFIWTNSNDGNRVRPQHRNATGYGGNKYSWKLGADGDFPGTPIQCRCVAINDYSIFF